MKLEPVEVLVTGSHGTKIYGVRIKNVPDELLKEMKQYAKSIGGSGFMSSTVWFENESARTMFLLRWS